MLDLVRSGGVLVLAVALGACSEGGSGGIPAGSSPTGGSSTGGSSTGGSSTSGGNAGMTTSSGGGQGGAPATGGAGGGGESPCLAGAQCVLTLPFHGEGDTSVSGSTLFDSYSCAPSVDESGPEIIYDVLVPQAGTLSATVTDGPTVDIDPNIVASIKDGTCLARDDVTASAAVEAGHVYVVADTYVKNGVAQVGPYTIDITLTP